jgi:proline iminopeptidase
MRTLFPAIKPYRIHHVDVDALHTLYVEECGIPDGLPIVFLHGGPGGSCEPYHRCYFDPSIYRIVLFDQRGCGQSTPHAELRDNTTWHLVEDMETLRERLAIDRWVLFGGSWGSTLALAYAERYPERVRGIILRGVFLCRPEDIAWFYQQGASRLFPDLWQDFLAPIPESERDDMVGAYYRRLTGEDEITRMAAAKAWSIWEGRTATLRQDRRVLEYFSNPFVAMSIARIECHYFINDAFLEPDQLLRDAPALAEMPGIIVHGRYDVVCPVDQAWALNRAWPGSRLDIIPDCGHAATERGIVDALVKATDEMAQLLK